MDQPATEEDERWRSVLDIYQAASEIEPAGRDAFLKSTQCTDDVAAEVLALLNSLDQPGVEVTSGEKDVKLRSAFSRYVMGPPLGKGGTGQVYSAMDVELDRTVALKFLDPAKLGALTASQLVREAKAASALNHPNIVTVYEVVESNSSLAIVMELVEGSVLRTLIGRPMPVAELCQAGIQIARALAAAHQARIIHRDVKPENIIVRPDGYIKLLDFGLAKHLDSANTIADLPLGTLPYMSPEQARGGAITPATDLFSLGIVLHELATGRHPFPAGSPFGIADAILTANPTIHETAGRPLPVDLRRLFLALLDKRPQHRPTAQQVVDQLEILAAGKFSRRLPAAVFPFLFGKGGRVTALVVLVALSLALAAWYRARPRPQTRLPTLSQITTQIPENRVTASAISSDGNLLAFATADGVFARELSSNLTYPLPSPPNVLIDKLRWMNDGTHLLAGGFSPRTEEPAIWRVSLRHDPARLVRTGARDPEPSPDGKRFAFTDGIRSVIWTVGLDGEDLRKVYGPKAAERYSVLLWTPSGTGLRFQRRKALPHSAIVDGPWDAMADESLTEHHYVSVDLQTGRILADIPNVSMNSGFGVPDGRVFFVGYSKVSPGSGFELWELSTDAKTGRPLASPRRTNTEIGWFSGVTATADGRKLVMLRSFDSHVIQIGDYSAVGPKISNVRRLTLDASSSFPHSWSLDSKSVIFESNRGGSYDLYKQQVGSRTAENIFATPKDETLPMLANGGKWILFREGHQNKAAFARLMRVHVDGSSAEPVPLDRPLDEFACALRASRCVLRQSEDKDFYIFYELDPLKGRGAELARTKRTESVFGDWAISPDGSEIAMPVHDSQEARIRLISLGQKAQTERELAIPGFSNLNGLNWSADGKGFLVVFNSSIGMQLIYIDRHARPTPLLEATFALPSPDGRLIALMIESVATNAWLIQNF